MLNKKLVNVLGALTGIASSVVLKYPVTILNSDAGDIVIRLNIQPLDETPFEEFGIYNLSEFLSTFKLFNDYKCTQEENSIKIDSDGSSLQYLCTNLAALESHNKPASLIERIEVFPSVATFTLTKDDVKLIKSAAGVFKTLNDVVFEASDKMVIKLDNTNSFNAKSNTFAIKKESEITQSFKVTIPSENFITLPLSDYTVEVKYNESKQAYRIIMKSTEIDMQVLLAVKK